MMGWAASFFFAAVFAAVLEFGDISAGAAQIVETLAFIFLFLSMTSLIASFAGKRMAPFALKRHGRRP